MPAPPPVASTPSTPGTPAGPPAAQRPTTPEETGPVFLDETAPEPGSSAAPAWSADSSRQSGFGAPADDPRGGGRRDRDTPAPDPAPSPGPSPASAAQDEPAPDAADGPLSEHTFRVRRPQKRGDAAPTAPPAESGAVDAGTDSGTDSGESGPGTAGEREFTVGLRRSEVLRGGGASALPGRPHADRTDPTSSPPGQAQPARPQSGQTHQPGQTQQPGQAQQPGERAPDSEHRPGPEAAAQSPSPSPTPSPSQPSSPSGQPGQGVPGQAGPAQRAVGPNTPAQNLPARIPGQGQAIQAAQGHGAPATDRQGQGQAGGFVPGQAQSAHPQQGQAQSAYPQSASAAQQGPPPAWAQAPAPGAAGVPDGAAAQGQAPAQVAGLPAQPQTGGPDAVTPWRPPVDDPFARAARQQARPGGLGKRLGARLVDLVLTLAVAGGVAFPFVGKVTDHIEAKVDAVERAGETKQVWLLDGTTGAYLGLVLGALVVFGLLYEVLPTARWGRTLGKKLFGLRVVHIESHDKPGFGAALVRWLVHGILGLAVVGLLNVLWCVFDRPWRQCWHDKLARTFVAQGDSTEIRL